MAVATKNLKSKTVKAANAYEVYVTRDLSWVWYVLKHWQSEDKERTNEYARVFCDVRSPLTYGQPELGDVYLSEIKAQAIDAREALKSAEQNLAAWEASLELGHGRTQSIVALKVRIERLKEIIAGRF